MLRVSACSASVDSQPQGDRWSLLPLAETERSLQTRTDANTWTETLLLLEPDRGGKVPAAGGGQRDETKKKKKKTKCSSLKQQMGPKPNKKEVLINSDDSFV